MKLISPAVCLCLFVFVSGEDKKVQKKAAREGKGLQLQGPQLQGQSNKCRQDYSNEYHTDTVQECHQRPVTKYENQCHTETVLEPVEHCTGGDTQQVCVPLNVATQKELCHTYHTRVCNRPHSRKKRGALQAVLLASAIAAQGRGTHTTCEIFPHTYCRQHPTTYQRLCRSQLFRHCIRERRFGKREASRKKRGVLQALLLTEAINQQAPRRRFNGCYSVPHTECSQVPVTKETQSCHEEVTPSACSIEQVERQVKVCNQAAVEVLETTCTEVP